MLGRAVVDDDGADRGHEALNRRVERVFNPERKLKRDQ